MFVRSHPVPAADPAASLLSRLVLWFFRHFFVLLLLAISIGQLALLWWVTAGFHLVPDALYVGAVPFVFALNTYLATGERRRRQSPGSVGALPATYYAFAFASVFCGIFLGASALAWLGGKALVQAVNAQDLVGTSPMMLNSAVDWFFRWGANLGITTICLSFVYGYSIGQARLKVRVLRIPMLHAPASWKGLRIAHISDIHVGHNLDPNLLRSYVARVNDLDPDIVCITGDIADSARSDLDTFFPILAGLRAKCGVFAILGNHDHYAGPERVVAALKRHTTFTVLRDEWTQIDVRGTVLAVIGVDDRGRDWARGCLEVQQLDEAMASVQAGDPVLLLSHRPDPFPHAARLGVSLMLSGHTHGGQIGMPWINGRVRNLAEFITRFDRGLFELDGAHLYVSCGLGVTGQRVRLCTPREITLLEVDAGSVAA